MANETRTMLVVLVVCGFLMLGCIGIPVGVGALMFLRLSQEAEMAQAQAVSAMAAERQARDQFEAIRQNQGVNAIAPPATAGIPPIPAPPGAPNFTPPIAIPGLAQLDHTDVEQRKAIYRPLKVARELSQIIEQSLLAAGQDEASLKPTIDEMKKKHNEELDRVCQAYGITRKQLDDIVAEGDKEGW